MTMAVQSGNSGLYVHSVNFTPTDSGLEPMSMKLYGAATIIAPKMNVIPSSLNELTGTTVRAILYIYAILIGLLIF